MKAFAALFQTLDATTSTAAKQAALQAYFRSAPPADAAWAVYLLAGGKPRQCVPARRLRELACAAAGLPAWLFDECYQAAGDLAETIALLLPPARAPEEHSLAHWMHAVRQLRTLPEAQRDVALRAQWERLSTEQRLLHGKLITGALRVGVSRQQVTQALATVAGLPPALVAQRLMGYTRADACPGPQDYLALVAPCAPMRTDAAATAASAAAAPDAQPYPFFLAHPLPAEPQDPLALLGPVANWIVEWKWDGIRAQLVRRQTVALWTRGEELVTDRYPELAAVGQRLPPGTVLDGEIVVVAGDAVQPFAALQRRIGRQRLTPALLRELPVALVAYDMLEADGRDCRREPQWQRRARLQALVDALADPALRISPTLPTSAGTDWATLAQARRSARTQGAEGLMLKQRDGGYGIGRTRSVGTWWKWKADPWTVDAVLVYAQKGHGRRAGLYSDYTFAVWSHAIGHPQRQLVPFAKAYAGLSDAEMARVDAIIRRTTRESFGPVRAVEPTLVFELGFEGIARSPRHKSGVAVRFPRMLRWRTDKPVEEADCLPTLLALLDATGPGGGP
ncbi:MAG: ATP-dependent DNA ligase [Pseudomonadota bacterium]